MVKVGFFVGFFVVVIIGFDSTVVAGRFVTAGATGVVVDELSISSVEEINLDNLKHILFIYSCTFNTRRFVRIVFL